MKQWMSRLGVLCIGVLLLAGMLLGCSKGDATKAQAATKAPTLQVEEQGHYTSKKEVALYIHTFKKLPANYITKKAAEKLGWKKKGTLDKVAPGKSIGGDRFHNFDKKLPEAQGRSYRECDIDYVKGNRGPKRIVFSNDGLIFYCGDHYNTFEKLY